MFYFCLLFHCMTPVRAMGREEEIFNFGEFPSAGNVIWWQKCSAIKELFLLSCSSHGFHIMKGMTWELRPLQNRSGMLLVTKNSSLMIPLSANRFKVFPHWRHNKSSKETKEWPNCLQNGSGKKGFATCVNTTTVTWFRWCRESQNKQWWIRSFYSHILVRPKSILLQCTFDP